MPRADIRVENHGSICLLHLLSKRARLWITEHVDEEAQWFGQALVVEPRYIADLVQGMLDEGFRVRVPGRCSR